MTAGKATTSQSKLLPFLLLVLALLLGYLVYTRLMTPTTATVDTLPPLSAPAASAPGAPPAPATGPAAEGPARGASGPGVAGGSPGPAATAAPAARPGGKPTGPLAELLPKEPVGRADPFVAVGGLRGGPAGPGARPAAPLPPAVPPPFFPGRAQPGFPGGGALPGPGQQPLPQLAAKAIGVLQSDAGIMAILAIGEKTHIVRIGDSVEGFRVATIDSKRVVLRQGGTEVVALLGGDEKK